MSFLSLGGGGILKLVKVRESSMKFPHFLKQKFSTFFFFK
jgi:hypothetical protein